ncbi:MAG: SCO family protein [Candidatus Eiseniibacteriota bacterium]
MKRRVGAGAVFALGLAAALLAGCQDDTKWHATNVTGALPALDFSMTRADDGKAVTQADYKGDVVLLYFGYTFCPDVCPTTLTNLADVLKRLGPQASHVRVLFVTVDPNRDSVPVMKTYAAAFAPEVDGLRGTPDAIAALARRYRVAYSVTPETKDHPYEVTHGSAIYVFDETGAARLLVTGLSAAKPDIDGVAADVRRLIEQASPPDLITRILQLV